MLYLETFFAETPCFMAAHGVTLVAALALCPKILETWWGPTNGTLSLSECRLSVGDTDRWCDRWWEH